MNSIHPLQQTAAALLVSFEFNGSPRGRRG
jgi:hypothetical protein